MAKYEAMLARRPAPETDGLAFADAKDTEERNEA
jgi:hypothetical protein